MKFTLLIVTDYLMGLVFVFDFELYLLKIQALLIELFGLFENLYFTFAFDLVLDYLKLICLVLSSNNAQLPKFRLGQLVYFFGIFICQHFVL